MPPPLTISDLRLPLVRVAQSRPQWQRGDIAEAVAQTLDLSARNAHERTYVAWIWLAVSPDGDPVWLLPVRVLDAARFSSRGPVTVLLRCIRAATIAGADPGAVTLIDWEGFVGLCTPGADPQLAPLALHEAHPVPARVEVCRADVVADGPTLEYPAVRGTPTSGLGRLGAQMRTHPLTFVHVLLEQGWTLDEATYPESVNDILRHQGFEGPERARDEPSLAIEDDPCSRRRFARRLVRRLLHKRKIGEQYHTAFDHIAHGVAPDERADAYAIGEALIRVGILGQKPSSGQRHVFLRREALPEIHALVERAESPESLRNEWSCDPPGAA